MDSDRKLGLDIVEDLKNEKDEQKKSRLTFQLNDRPPFHIALFYGFQIIFCNLPGSVAAVFLTHQVTCGGQDYEYLAKLMSSVIFMCGLASLLQVLFGSRLPITQGSSFVFFSPIAAMMSSEQWKCSRSLAEDINGTMYATIGNSTLRYEDVGPEWGPRVAQISGALVGASCVQVFLGASGVIGFLMNFIGPLTLAPTVMLIGLTLFPFAVDSSRHQWWISVLTVALIVIFSTVCAEVQVPILTWNRKRGFHIRRYPLIRMFANILAMGLTWILCYVLTATNTFTDKPEELGYLARTDAKIDALVKIPWLYFPHPEWAWQQVFKQWTQNLLGNEMLKISGALVGASCVQVFLGASGVIGFLMNFIGPLTLAPTVMLIGLTLFPFAVDSSRHQWWISVLTVALIVIFSTVCAEVQVPILTWNRKRGFHIRRYPLIRMFANILAMGLTWILCYVLTATNTFTDKPEELGYLARTDAKIDALVKIPWLYFPHPGQFGPITFGADIFVGMLAVTISSTVESIGDYYATARISEVPKPPIHALNRGIALEGVASVFSGLTGCCHGTTSYSNVIGFISYTGVASRFTWIIMSVLLMVFGVFGKFAGALATIPEPVVGGATALCLGLVVLIGMTQLHSVDLMSTRNQITLALAVGFGMMFPDYLARTPGAITTGNEVVDRTLFVFLSTGPFVGGLIGFLMDNLLPGTRAERGMLPEEEGTSISGHRMTPEEARKIYDFPFPTLWLHKYKICTYLPFMPCFKPRNIPSPCSRSSCCKEKDSDVENTVITKDCKGGVVVAKTTSF